MNLASASKMFDVVNLKTCHFIDNNHYYNIQETIGQTKQAAARDFKLKIVRRKTNPSSNKQTKIQRFQLFPIVVIFIISLIYYLVLLLRTKIKNDKFTQVTFHFGSTLFLKIFISSIIIIIKSDQHFLKHSHLIFTKIAFNENEYYIELMLLFFINKKLILYEFKELQVCRCTSYGVHSINAQMMLGVCLFLEINMNG